MTVEGKRPKRSVLHRTRKEQIQEQEQEPLQDILESRQEKREVLQIQFVERVLKKLFAFLRCRRKRLPASFTKF